MKAKNIIYSLLFLWSLCSCYEDKGNYDYDPLLEITIDSIVESYMTYSLIDTIRISPMVTPENIEYDYWWGIYQNSVQGFVPTLDTLCYTCDLEMPVALAPGSYSLVFCAKDRNTGIAKIAKASLTVYTSLSRGWYVLRSQNGYTDFDVFTGTDKIENVIAVNNNGKNLKGEARAVARMTTYQAWDETNSRYASTNTIFALSSEDIAAIRIENGVIIRTIDNIFFEYPAVVSPQDMYVTESDIYLVNAGKLYTINGITANSGRFGMPKTGNYQLAPYHVYNYPRYPLLYDETSASFCTCNTTADALISFSDKGQVDSIPLPPVNNLDADLLFMGATSGKCAYALIKKRQQDMYCMMYINAQCASPYKNPVLNCDTLDNTLGILKADKWATNTVNHIIYFAQGNMLYSCNIDNSYREDPQFTFPVNETVTYMRHLTYNNFSDPDMSFDHLVVASYDGTNYKVYLFNLQAGNLQPNPMILEGQGKVGALVYIDGTGGTQLQ